MEKITLADIGSFITSLVGLYIAYQTYKARKEINEVKLNTNHIMEQHLTDAKKGSFDAGQLVGRETARTEIIADTATDVATAAAIAAETKKT